MINRSAFAVLADGGHRFGIGQDFHCFGNRLQSLHGHQDRDRLPLLRDGDRVVGGFLNHGRKFLLGRFDRVGVRHDEKVNRFREIRNTFGLLICRPRRAGKASLANPWPPWQDVAMARRLTRFMIYLLLLIPLAFLVFCGFLYFQQDEMVFRPSRFPLEESERRAAAEGFAPWRNAKGDLIGWQSLDGDPAQVLLVMNGNGGSALSRTYYRQIGGKTPEGWKTFLLEYPGYGSRDGQPSESALTAAACEAVDVLASEFGGTRTIWVLGESLGSGTASATARERPNQIAGLILVTPFNSLIAAAQFYYPWMPVGAFLRTRFASDENLANYPGPVAFLLGAKDQTVPAVLGQKLYDGYKGRKRLWIDPAGTHDLYDLIHSEWPAIVTWLQVQRKEAATP